MSHYLQNNMLLPTRNLEQNNWWSFILAPLPLKLHSRESFVFANKNGRVRKRQGYFRVTFTKLTSCCQGVT